MKKNILILFAVVLLFLVGQYAFSSTTTDGNSIITGTLAATGHTTFEGVTSTGATGTGKLVYDGSPTLITPNLGTPSALVLTNATGTLANKTYYGTLGSSFVATDESTSSASFVGLTTPDTVTFTLGATANVNAVFSSTCYLSTGATNSITWEFNLDTVDQSGGLIAITNNNFDYGCQLGQKMTSLAAGSHTIIMKYKTGAGTAHWLSRNLLVVQTP